MINTAKPNSYHWGECDGCDRLLDYLTRCHRIMQKPSIREMKDSCKFSSTSVTDYHLHHLAKWGAIRLASGGKTRSVTVLGLPSYQELEARALSAEKRVRELEAVLAMGGNLGFANYHDTETPQAPPRG